MIADDEEFFFFFAFGAAASFVVGAGVEAEITNLGFFTEKIDVGDGTLIYSLFNPQPNLINLDGPHPLQTWSFTKIDSVGNETTAQITNFTLTSSPTSSGVTVSSLTFSDFAGDDSGVVDFDLKGKLPPGQTATFSFPSPFP